VTISFSRQTLFYIFSAKEYDWTRYWNTDPKQSAYCVNNQAPRILLIKYVQSLMSIDYSISSVFIVRNYSGKPLCAVPIRPSFIDICSIH